MAKITDFTQAGKSVSALEFGSLHMQVFPSFAGHTGERRASNGLG